MIEVKMTNILIYDIDVYKRQVMLKGLAGKNGVKMIKYQEQPVNPDRWKQFV